MRPKVNSVVFKNFDLFHCTRLIGFWISFCGALLSLSTLYGCREDEKTDSSSNGLSGLIDHDTALPAYGIHVSDVMEFTEGVQTVYKLEAWVPAPGSPVVHFSDMPDGMVYDEDKSELVWQPSFDAANDSENLSVTLRYYVFSIKLYSNKDQLVTPLEKRVVALVHDNPQKFEFSKIHASYKLTEGKQFEQTVRIISKDFPDGPFIFETQGLPVDALVLNGKRKNEFIVRWTPWYYEVEDRGDTKSYNITYTVTNLRGKKIVSPTFSWVVHDSREISNDWNPFEDSSKIQFFLDSDSDSRKEL